MDFPHISEEKRIERLNHLQTSSEVVEIVLDTDTYNEVDDQFAVTYALLSKERISVKALYAAPFHNPRSSGPADGMEKSYQEIYRLLNRLGKNYQCEVFRGSTSYLPGEDTPCQSEAANDLIHKAMSRNENEPPLFVVAIGAITNIASAIIMQPEIINRIVVVWLGGHAFHWPDTREFNLQQDIYASRLIFNCGVPLILIPVMGVTSHLHTTVAELEKYAMGRGDIGDYLVQTVKDYHKDHFAWSKVIWDISSIAFLVNQNWVPTYLTHSPILTDQVTWSFDNQRHFIKYAWHIHRDPIFRDLFEKLEIHSETNL